MAYMKFITGLGNFLILLPLSAIIFFWLWRWETKAAAKIWIYTTFLCLATVLALKLVFLSCHVLYFDIQSPSGHTAFSAIVLGSAARIISAHSQKWAGLIINAIAWLIILAIAFSRFFLGMHTASEVVIALIIGSFAYIFFSSRYSRCRRPALNPMGLFLGIVIVAVACYGLKFPVESKIKEIASQIRIITNFSCG